MSWIQGLKGTHDLRLPAWGPYTKRYIGISHIADPQKGLRFDLSVFPGFYRRRVEVPNVMWESGYHPWEASADFTYYCHRHELEWKDQVYCDISFSAASDTQRLIRCEYVNNTDHPQNLVLHYMASLHYPTARPRSTEPLRVAQVILPSGGIWVDALDYTELHFAIPRPTDNLVYDGYLRGEIRQSGFVSGSGVGLGLGQDQGDKLLYRFALPAPLSDACLLFRYRMASGHRVVFDVRGTVQGRVEFVGQDDLQVQCLPVGNLDAGEHSLALISLGGAPITLDGFAVVPRNEADSVRFKVADCNVQPKLLSGPSPNSLVLKYDELEHYYGIAWDYPPTEVREFYTDDLDDVMRLTVHHHAHSVFYGPGEGHFTNVFMRPILLKPHSSQVVYGWVCHGDRAEVEKHLTTFAKDVTLCEKLYQQARLRVVEFDSASAGQGFLFSQKRMAATLLTNVVYPVYTKRSFIRHNTPGRWWDSLYTWDSGFIGLGLAELDVQRAVDCLNAYMTEPGDEQAAFIHHGSPVPVQHYLFLELWNRTRSKDLLEYFYPRLRQYYRFMAGHLGSSTTRKLKSNLIKTWDYFYNSGGWDDYPPQVHVHQHHLEETVAPVVNTAHCIRTAKILRMAALALGEKQDLAEYDADIATFAEALQAYSWDALAGYFGYVCHDGEGNPTGILHHESGTNYNMGLDGVYPLVAGICTIEQEEILLRHLRSEQQLWTRIGLSTVDQSAPYFRVDGYWNGAVWMPHQWFFWKTMLDLGQSDFAFQIADTALQLWKSEVEASYNCFEHFIIATGRGAGWHHFGGLSSPILNWFGAYYRPGRLTCGFDVWAKQVHLAEGNQALEADLSLSGRSGRCLTVIANMSPEPRHRVIWNGMPVSFRERFPGVLEISLPCEEDGHLQIVAE